MLHPSHHTRRLEQTAAALQATAQQYAGGSGPLLSPAVRQQLEALSKAAQQLHAALVAASAGQPPTALRLLQALLREAAPAAIAACPLPPPPAAQQQQLAALHLQACAAAAAVQQQLESSALGQQAGGSAAAAAGVETEEQRQRFAQLFMGRFADSFAPELEALQEAEPPLPDSGVLLRAVLLMADSGALHPPHHRRLVLQSSLVV